MKRRGGVTLGGFYRLTFMAIGRRKNRVRQEGLRTPTAALPVSASHPFYQRLNQILEEKRFDEYVETICEEFYAGEVADRACRRGSISGC
jgi:hypothetical protein